MSHSFQFPVPVLLCRVIPGSCNVVWVWHSALRTLFLVLVVSVCADIRQESTKTRSTFSHHRPDFLGRSMKDGNEVPLLPPRSPTFSPRQLGNFRGPVLPGHPLPSNNRDQSEVRRNGAYRTCVQVLLVCVCAVQSILPPNLHPNL